MITIMIISLYQPLPDKTYKISGGPEKTQISLGICPVWSESSLCAQLVAKNPRFLHADSEDSDQTGPMPRLIWVFAGRTLILLVLSCHGLYTCGTCQTSKQFVQIRGKHTCKFTFLAWLISLAITVTDFFLRTLMLFLQAPWTDYIIIII